MKYIYLIFILLISTISNAAEITLHWDASENATGYKIYISLDCGQSWDDGLDVGNVTTYKINVPDHQLVLLRASAYNNFGESIRTDAGVFYNSDWKRPGKPSEASVE